VNRRKRDKMDERDMEQGEKMKGVADVTKNGNGMILPEEITKIREFF
jgi:hypothetical protein